MFPYMSELFRIISGALRLDTVKVRNYASFLADKLEADGDAPTAGRLRQLLAETDRQLRPTDMNTTQALPVDGESRFALIENVNVRDLKEEPLVVSRDQQDVIDEFISVAKCHGQFEAHGVSTSATLLLYGPPGCGKSRLARHIARELGLPLYLARLDGLISSFLGSTSKNIRMIFDFAARTPCALLLDEFDALAKLRDDKQELGELKRVVNSFLQNLDTIGSQSVVIAATNHHLLLDAAVWRRFSYTLELKYPAPEQRQILWKQFLGNITWRVKDIAVLVDLSEGFSGAEIHDVCLRLRRQSIVHGTTPTIKDAFFGLRRIVSGEKDRKRFLATLNAEDGPEVVRKLKRRNPKLYSHSELGALLGTSKATAYRWQVKAGVKNG
ncbi:MAG: ATP-binding protein [Elusimicrobia bacterium]|nr:ATP-binding protein [Elusimicrobiota bacterium]